MIIQQKGWTKEKGWQIYKGEGLKLVKPLVLVFANRFLLEKNEIFEEVKTQYPDSEIIVCSSAGEILNTSVNTETISLTAIQFEKSTVNIYSAQLNDYANSYEASLHLAKQIMPHNLKHVVVFCDGQLVNGSELAKAFNEALPKNVATSGGLAGDDTRFEKTLVGYNGLSESGLIVAIAFYGDIKVGYGSFGGWDVFGPERTITASNGNKLYELDNKSALELYKTYLGDKADELPGSALLFPLSIKRDDTGMEIVRTILSVDEEEQSMTFAGDMPKGAKAQLMKANFDRLIDGAYLAAEGSVISLKDKNIELALLVSCVGRKIVLDQLVEEEVEGAREIIGDNAAITGFYSYGELSPFAGKLNCELHNQTMSITVFTEN